MKAARKASCKAQTQLDIAIACNLSRATVGKVLSGGKAAQLFSQDTQRKVWEATRNLGYRPNRAAQVMRKGRSNLIAIIYFNSSVEDGGRAAGFLPQEIKERGFDYLVFDYLWHGSSMDDILHEVTQLRAEGVVLLGLPAGAFTPDHAKTLADFGIPAVALGADENLPGTAAIICDSTHAIQQLTHHLLHLGHQKILMLSPSAEGRARQERMAGFKQGISGSQQCRDWNDEEFLAEWPELRKSGGVLGSMVSLTVDQTNPRSYADSVYKFCKNLFATGHLPDAIMCSNDVGAISVFLAAHEFGIRIPDDLAVTGYDNDDLGAYPMFDLTTARQEVEQSCIAAVKVITSMIGRGILSGNEQSFSPTVVLRGSCGRHLKSFSAGSPRTSRNISHVTPDLPKPHNKTMLAFTLVELIVSVAIIAILVLLTFAGASAVMDAGKSAQCISNLRTLGTGFASFAAENNNLFPNASQGGFWPGAISQYVPRKAFFCPVEKKGNVLNLLEDDKKWKEQQPFVSYGYNNRYLAPDFGFNWSVPRPRDDITYSRMSRMTSVLLLADAGRVNSNRKSSWGFYVVEPAWLNYSMPVPRHRGNANILWTDGSVSARPATMEKVKKEDSYEHITKKNWDWRLE